MLGERYIVKKGDNLWRIAAATLGRGKEWPRIWHYNNRPEIARITGRKIPNPDRIYVGQLLVIPRLSTLPVTRDSTTVPPKQLQPAEENPRADGLRQDREATGQEAGGSPLSDQLRRLKIPLIFRFRLGDLAWPPQDVGTAVIQIKMSGEVLLKSQTSYAATLTVSREDIEAQVSKEANHAFGKLISENKFSFEPSSKKVTLSSMLISQSNAPNSVATAFGVEISSDSPTPKLKAEIKLPTLQGSISGFEYVAVDTSVSIEVTPRSLSPRSDGLKKEVQDAPSLETGTSWAVVLGAGLAVAAAGLIVATLVEDFATGGLGLADDPITFSVSGTLLARGLALMGVAAIAGAPKASAQARVELKATVGLQGREY